jgi:hypothetical protein
VGSGDDRRRALRREGIKQRVGLGVVRRAVVDAGDHVRVQVDERPGMNALAHASSIDAERERLE